MTQQPSLPKVGIVILNFNCRDLLEECVGSSLTQSYPNAAVWVVDNGSTDGSMDLVRTEFPQAELVQTKANIGFAGLNMGINKALDAGCRYIMYLDSDAKLDASTISALVEYLEEHADCGMAGPQQYRMSTGAPYFLGGVIDVRTLWARWIPSSLQPVDCDYLGNALIRSEILEKVQFDERFFTYYADTDLCLRVKAMGYRVVGVPSAKMYSLQSYTSSIVPGLRGYIPARNRIIFASKHTPRRYWLVALPLAFADSTMRMAHWILRGQLRNAAFVFIGFVSGLAVLLSGREPRVWRDLAMNGMGRRIVIAASESGST